MITFILNNKTIKTDAHPGTTLLDFIRYDEHLPGTKIGCREGDCGACTVLEGAVVNGKVHYKSIVSCLTPLGNAQGKHIVSIEGVNIKELSPVQESMVEHAGTQCGFCTPGFVMSLTGHCMSEEESTTEKAIASISGNICRCTGYKSIEKAAASISGIIQNKDIQQPIDWMVEHKFLPDYFSGIAEKLKDIQPDNPADESKLIIAGGTDLMVQRPEEIEETDINLINNLGDLKGIKPVEDSIVIGSACSASDIMNSPIIQNAIPGIRDYFKLVSSVQIRNMGTIAGNFVNASPIGDLSVLFLALNAKINVKGKRLSRSILLRDFFLDYKITNLKKGEFLESVSIPSFKNDYKINFEKVSKRTHLDIASVNSAISIKLIDGVVAECAVAAGGVSPIPKFLHETSTFLVGKQISKNTLLEANRILQEEIMPISDVRGTMKYKRLLMRQLFFAHFLTLYPERISLNDLIS